MKYQFVRENIHEHLTQIEHVSSDYMLVDPLTKALAVGMFKRHVLGIGLIESFDTFGLVGVFVYFETQITLRFY